LISVFPNPFRERLVVQSDEFEITQDQIQLYDLFGKQYPISSATHISNGIEMDLRELSSGHYILRLIGDGRQEIFHLIKE